MNLDLRTLEELLADFNGPLPEQLKMLNMIYSLHANGGVQSVNNKTGAVTLNAADVGALPDTYTPPVSSVNSQTGNVVLDAEDVGALPDTYTPPVSSVNSKTGAVTLNAADVGAAASGSTVNLTGNQSINGDKTFNGATAIPAPTANNHAATKKYVDDADTAYYNAAVTAMNSRFSTATRTAVNALTGASTAADIVAALKTL